MNPRLERLQPYPFERLRELLAGTQPSAPLKPLNLQIRHPHHPTPPLPQQPLPATLPSPSPHPFLQIHEGATILGGAKPYFVNALGANAFLPDWEAIPEDVWKRTRLLFACSPNNPNGRVMPISEWKLLFDLAERHGFVIVADE